MPSASCMKRDTSSPHRIQLRTYACAVGEDLFKRRLGRLVTNCPAFNGSFLWQERPRMHRIGGMDQHGDILVRQAYQKEGSTVTIEYRAGDEGLVDVLAREMANDLTPGPNPPSPLKNRLPGMVAFLQMIQGQSLGRKVIIADSAIESALGLDFAGYREARLELELLARLQALRGTHPLESQTLQQRYHRAMRRLPNAKVCLCHGRKVRLPHRIEAREPKGGRMLAMYFALLPTGQPLVGWVE